MCLLWRFVALCRREGLNLCQRKRKARRQSGSELAFQIAEERREEKGQGEWERHIQLNAEFHRIVRRYKKVLLNEQCKEIKESNRMGKIRDLFKKVMSKGTHHAHMGSIRDRNSMDLTEAKYIKKRWQECTELYKKRSSRPR